MDDDGTSLSLRQNLWMLGAGAGWVVMMFGAICGKILWDGYDHTVAVAVIVGGGVIGWGLHEACLQRVMEVMVAEEGLNHPE